MSSLHNPQPGTSSSSNMASQGPTARAQKRKSNIPIQADADKNEIEIENGAKNFLHGNLYQLRLLMLYGYICYYEKYEFKLYAEVSAADKIDDVVLEYNINNVQNYIFLQAKHSLNDDSMITYKNLDAPDNNFFLHKYFTSYLNIKSNERFKSGHKLFIINTNINFKLAIKNGSKTLGELYFQPFDISMSSILKVLNVGGIYYKLGSSNPKEREVVVTILKSWFIQRTDFKILAQKLAECLVNNNKIDFKQPLFRKYHNALVREVIDIKKAKLKLNFIENKELSLEAIAFRQTVLQKVEKTYKKTEAEFLNSLTFSEPFVKNMVFEENPELDSVTMTEIITLIVEEKNRTNPKKICAINVSNEDLLLKMRPLAGHVLIQKNKTVTFSQSFLNENKTLPTNITKFKNELFKEFGNKASEELKLFTFEITGFKTCKEEEFNELTFPKDEVSEEDIKGFMDEFIFAMKQPNEKDLGKIVSGKIEKDSQYLNAEMITNFYQTQMLDWFKRKQSGPLTQYDIQLIFKNANMEIDILKSIDQYFPLMNKLKDYDVSFKKETLPKKLLEFFKSSEAVQNRICILNNSDTLIGSLKVNQALQESFEYNNGFIFIKLTDLLLKQEMVINVFEIDKMRLLIIVCETKNKDVTEIYKILSEHLQNSNKRLLLVGSEKHPLIKSFLSPDLSFELEQENRFSDFTSESQQTLLLKEVTFQGHKIPLNQLVDDQQENIINLISISDLLENKSENIGDKIQKSVGYNTKYYIKRNFQKEAGDSGDSNLILTQVLLNKLRKHTHKKFIIMIETAGMGKSTVLTHLSLEIKKANPHFWVVRIDLNASTEAFIKNKKKLTSDNVVEFIVDKLLKLKELEKELFKHLLDKKKVVLMLDAFDEIRPSYEKKGIEFFESFKEINLRQIWITTRPYLKNEQKPELSLDELFPGDQVESLAITPFSRENQEEFLQKIWSQTCNIEQQELEAYTVDLIFKLIQSIDKDFASIPLHLFMIAKVYEPDEDSIDESKYRLEGMKIDLFSLYQQFLDTKIDINLGKGATSEHNDAKTEQKKDQKREINLWKAYEHSAIELIFPSQAKDILKYIERETVTPEQLTRSGIVAIKYDTISFVHRSFAEFFAAQFIMKELTKAHPNKFLQKFFITNILKEHEYAMIRKFLESFIEQSYQKDSRIGRLKNMGELIKEKSKSPKQILNEYNYSIIDIAALENNSYIIKFLSENLNVENCQDVFRTIVECNKGVAIVFASQKGSVEALDELLERFEYLHYSNDQNPLLTAKVEGKDAWAFAILALQLPILKKIWNYAKNQMKLSNEDLKKRLLMSKKKEKYIWHIAIELKNIEILKFLWECAKEIEAQNELFQCKNADGHTIMHQGFLIHYSEDLFETIVTFLLETNLDHKKLLFCKLEINNDGPENTLINRVYNNPWQPMNSKEIRETNKNQTAWFCAAYNGYKKLVLKLWEIAKDNLSQKELKELLKETNKDGNKAWLLAVMQAEDWPLSLNMARQLGTDAGLKDELYDELKTTQNYKEKLNLKERINERKTRKPKNQEAINEE